MSTVSCSDSPDLESCRDEKAALVLKLVAIATILIAGIGGVAIPLIGKKRRFLRTDTNLFFAAKAFAAGVILATGFVHMLPDATSALSNPCLPKSPWSNFPFSGFIAMMAALGTLVADFLSTQYYDRKQEKQIQAARVDSIDLASESGIVSVTATGKENEGNGIHIVGMHAHAAQHRHNHVSGHEGCEGQVGDSSNVNSHMHSHSHGFDDDDDESSIRHVVVSQVNFVLLFIGCLHLYSTNCFSFDDHACKLISTGLGTRDNITFDYNRTFTRSFTKPLYN